MTDFDLISLGFTAGVLFTGIAVAVGCVLGNGAWKGEEPGGRE